MTSKPPRLAVSLVELFAPIDSAEGVLGDLEEEFVGQLARSGLRAARHWYWRQALRTTLHLLWGAVRVAPWLTTALVLASFIGGPRLSSGLSPFLSHSAGRLPSSRAAERW